MVLYQMVTALCYYWQYFSSATIYQQWTSIQASEYKSNTQYQLTQLICPVNPNHGFLCIMVHIVLWFTNKLLQHILVENFLELCGQVFSVLQIHVTTTCILLKKNPVHFLDLVAFFPLKRLSYSQQEVVRMANVWLC